MSIPTIRVSYPVPFPALVQGSGLITVGKVNGIYTIGFSMAGLVDTAPAFADLANDQLIYYNKNSKVTALTSFSELIAAIGSTVRSMTGPRIITVAGAIAPASNDETIVLNYAIAGATTVNLPTVASRTPNGLPLDIYDWAGNAGDITINPNGAEKIMGANAPWIVASGGVAQSGGRIRLTPSTDLGGWLVKT